MIKRLLVSAVILVGTGAFAGLFFSGVQPPRTGASPDEVITAIVTGALLSFGGLAALWYALTAGAIIIAEGLALVGTTPTSVRLCIRRFGAPALRRIAVLTAASCVVAAPTWAASAIADPNTPSPVVDAAPATSGQVEESARNSAALVDLGWAPVPDPFGPQAAPHPNDPVPRDPEATNPEATNPEPGNPEATQPEAIQPEASNRESGDPEPSDPEPTDPEARIEATYRVERGDTLWDIARKHLLNTSASVTTADVAAHWPKWYAANADVIGPNPDLIHPGMILHAPTKERP